jgi:hypothetical protein
MVSDGNNAGCRGNIPVEESMMPMRLPIVGLALVLLLFAPPALAQDRTRVDLYDKNSARQGYAVIDRDSGRIDTYDKDSRRIGYGVVRPDGRLDMYKLDGTREESITPRSTPKPRR